MAELDNAETAAAYLSLQKTELTLMATGVGGGIQNTSDLKVLNYKRPCEALMLVVERNCKQKAQFNKYNTLTPVPRSSLPKQSKVLTTIWTKKKKSGTYCGRLNTMGYEQVDRMHYMSDSTDVPVTNPNTRHLVLTLLCMNSSWVLVITDVEGAFLQGKLENGEELHIEVPNGSKEQYQDNVVLKICTIEQY